MVNPLEDMHMGSVKDRAKLKNKNKKNNSILLTLCLSIYSSSDLFLFYQETDSADFLISFGKVVLIN